MSRHLWLCIVATLAFGNASCSKQSATGPSAVKGSDGSKASVSLLSWRVESCSTGYYCYVTLTVQNNGPDCVSTITLNGDFTLNGAFVYTAQWTLGNRTLGAGVRWSETMFAATSRMTVRQDYAFNPQIAIAPSKCS